MYTHNSKDVLRRFTEPLFRFIHVNTARSENSQIQHWSFRLCETKHIKEKCWSKILQNNKLFALSFENGGFDSFIVHIFIMSFPENAL